MRWTECLDKHVEERTPNPDQAKALQDLAKIRLRDNKRREPDEETTSLIVETYWEATKQITTALLLLNGYKSYSQECLLAYLRKETKISRSQIKRLDQLRRLRNDIDYRGAFLEPNYLDRNEDEIISIINDLNQLLTKHHQQKT